MPYGRWLIATCLIFWGILPLGAQPRMEENGPLRGVVQLRGGTPLAGVAVRLSSNEFDLTLVTDSTGHFAGMLPLGQYGVSVLTTSVTAIVRRDTPAYALVEIPVGGVLVAAQYPDGTPVDGLAMTCAYLAGAERRGGPTATPVSSGGYWFPGVPAAARFAVLARQPDMPVGTYTRGEWQPEGPALFRQVRLTLPQPAPLAFQVVDIGGRPLGEATVCATITCPLRFCELWEPEEQPLGFGDLSREATTDAMGRLELGLWPPRPYTITLRVNGTAGPTITGEVTPDGRCTLPARYTLSAPASEG